jgi:hypothetical protein
MNTHPNTCNCPLHAALLQARRDARYRELARAILGPAAPKSPIALAQALAAHAEQLKAA